MSPDAVAVTFFADRKAQLAREERLQLSDLAGMIREMTAADKGRLPFLKLARFGTARTEKGALRHDANVLCISGIEADYDAGEVGFDRAVEIAEKAGLLCVVYTSASYTAERPRWRVLCPVSQELPPSDRYRLVARLNGLYDAIFAAESFTLSQGFYYGHVAGSRDHRVELIDGQPIDELHELDRVAAGRPNGGAGGNGANGSGSFVDVAELEHDIISGENFHMSCTRLAGYWARYNVPLLDAHARLDALFDDVSPGDRDARWEERRKDALRVVADIYKKHRGGPATDEPEPEAAEKPEPAPAPAGPAWPEPLGAAAYHGVAGEILNILAPRTEADVSALLFQFLAVAGCHLGNDAWYFVEGSRHAPNLFVLVVGATATARKGTALAQSRRLFDVGWTDGHIRGGLSSGEGLIGLVRDRSTRIETNKKTGERTEIEDDPGVDDKRLLLVEEEFARTLRAAGRPENTLAAIIRQAWDGLSLATLTRKSALRATRPHISIIGHITTAELQAELDDTDALNGLANRFLFVCARRSRLLPFGGTIEPDVLDELRRRLAFALDSAPRGAIGLDMAARRMWEAAYPDIARDRHGLFGALTSRAAAQIMRVSLIYALLDGSERIAEAHLRAGLEVWRYAEQSARFAFKDRTGGKVADTILAGLRDAGADGLAKTQMHALLGRHANAASINNALRQLEEQGYAKRQAPVSTGGRPLETWVAT
jgi:hypothetical protein